MKIISILAGLLVLSIPVLAETASPSPIVVTPSATPNTLGGSLLMPEFKVVKYIDLSNIPEATLQMWGLAYDSTTDSLWVTNFGGKADGKLYRISKNPGGDGKAVILEGPITLTGNVPPYALGIAFGNYQSQNNGLWLGGANQSYQFIADPKVGNVKWVDYINIWSKNSSAGNGVGYNRKLDFLYMCDAATVQVPSGMDQIAWTVKPDKGTKWEYITFKKICGLECSWNVTDTPKQLFAMEREWEKAEDSELFGFWLVDGKPVFASWSVKVPGTKITGTNPSYFNLTADMTFDGHYFYIMVQESEHSNPAVDTIFVCEWTAAGENIESASLGEIKATYK